MKVESARLKVEGGDRHPRLNVALENESLSSITDGYCIAGSAKP